MLVGLESSRIGKAPIMSHRRQRSCVLLSLHRRQRRRRRRAPIVNIRQLLRRASRRAATSSRSSTSRSIPSGSSDGADHRRADAGQEAAAARAAVIGDMSRTERHAAALRPRRGGRRERTEDASCPRRSDAENARELAPARQLAGSRGDAVGDPRRRGRCARRRHADLHPRERRRRLEPAAQATCWRRWRTRSSPRRRRPPDLPEPGGRGALRHRARRPRSADLDRAGSRSAGTSDDDRQQRRRGAARRRA